MTAEKWLSITSESSARAKPINSLIGWTQRQLLGQSAKAEIGKVSVVKSGAAAPASLLRRSRGASEVRRALLASRRFPPGAPESTQGGLMGKVG